MASKKRGCRRNHRDPPPRCDQSRRFRRGDTMTGYVETHRRSLTAPEAFWAEAAAAIDWEKRWDRVYDEHSPIPTLPSPASGEGLGRGRWFSGARLNTCWNALDRHVAAGRGERIALIWDSPVTGQIQHFTYREL